MWAPKPEYSEQARKARLEGEVSLRCLIDEEGSARNCRVDRPAGLGLDEKAVAAVSQWKFSPGTRGGQRVAVEAGLKIASGLPAMEAYQFPGIWDARNFILPQARRTRASTKWRRFESPRARSRRRPR